MQEPFHLHISPQTPSPFPNIKPLHTFQRSFVETPTHLNTLQVTTHYSGVRETSLK